MDLYKLLRVGRTATLKEIQASYRKLAMEYHPDLNGGDQKKTAMFREIQSAYEKLSSHAREYEAHSGSSGTGSSSGYSQHSAHSNGSPGASPFAKTPRGFGRRRGGGPPPPGTYNVKAWNEGHFGSAANPYDTQFAATVDQVRTQKINRATAFMQGMEDNKTFQHSQRMAQREAAAAAAERRGRDL